MSTSCNSLILSSEDTIIIVRRPFQIFLSLPLFPLSASVFFLIRRASPLATRGQNIRHRKPTPHHSSLFIRLCHVITARVSRFARISHSPSASGLDFPPPPPHQSSNQFIAFWRPFVACSPKWKDKYGCTYYCSTRDFQEHLSFAVPWGKPSRARYLPIFPIPRPVHRTSSKLLLLVKKNSRRWRRTSSHWIFNDRLTSRVPSFFISHSWETRRCLSLWFHEYDVFQLRRFSHWLPMYHFSYNSALSHRVNQSSILHH